MESKPYPPTPELDKMKSVKDKSQIIGEFLDVLNQEGVYLAEYSHHELVPINRSIERILAQYFNIDLDKVEKERQALLEHIRSEQ